MKRNGQQLADDKYSGQQGVAGGGKDLPPASNIHFNLLMLAPSCDSLASMCA